MGKLREQLHDVSDHESFLIHSHDLNVRFNASYQLVVETTLSSGMGPIFYIL